MKLSVIMPVYNSQRYLREAIDSVLGQEFREFEFLIGDDCSRDGTVKLIESYSDPRIHVIKNPRNFGIFGNLNNLCRRAKGDLIKIFCGDDVMLPHCLRLQVAYMEKHPEIGYSRCHGTESDYTSARPPLRYQPQLPEIIRPPAAALAFFTFGNIPGNLSNVIMRKQCYEAVGGFREDLPYAGDFEMWSRMAERFPFGIQVDQLLFVRGHKGQASFTLNRRNELIPQLATILERLFASILNDGIAPPSLLRYHATVSYMVQQVHWSARLLIRGQFVAAAKIRQERRFCYPLASCFALYLLTFNGRVLLGWSTRALLATVERCNRSCL